MHLFLISLLQIYFNSCTLPARKWLPLNTRHPVTKRHIKNWLNRIKKGRGTKKYYVLHSVFIYIL